MQFAHFQFDPETDRLGEGPLSEVYKAVDQRLGRTVALKILRSHAEIDPEADTRFLNEAKHNSNLVHPNIATIYEYDQVEGTSYIAMEFLPGRTLDKILAHRALGSEECLRVAHQVTNALVLVHSRGLIHRDLKPANIMMLDDGIVKLLDFGIARATDEAGITQHGVMVGTVLYMSPEQVRGEDLDFRSDIFSLGSVLYQLLTGALPFPGKSFPEVCMAILDGKPKPPSALRHGVPKPLEEFTLKCLQPDPEDRFQTTMEAHGALLSIADLLKVSTGTSVVSNIRGTLVIPPLICNGNDTGSCAVLASGLRKDLASELDRVKGLSIALIDESLPDSDFEFDFLIRGDLQISGSSGTLDMVLEQYTKIHGDTELRNTLRERIEHEDEDEWALQADIVRSAVRILRKQLAELSLTPADHTTRNTEESQRHAQRAHEILQRGTSKSLMAAISSFRRAIDEDPYCAIAHAGLAEAMMRKFLYWDGDSAFLEEGRQHAQRALALDSNCAEAHTSLGYAFHLSGHTTDAQREYRLAIQNDNEEWLAHRLLGEVLARDGNFQAAAPLLRRSIAIHPIHIGSFDLLFTVLQRLDRYEEALEIADRGIAEARKHLRDVPDNQEARLGMALLLARLQSGDEARAVVHEARQLRAKDGYTAFLASRVFAILGDVEEAVEALSQAQSRGFFIQGELIRNADLDVLRGLPGFQVLAS